MPCGWSGDQAQPERACAPDIHESCGQGCRKVARGVQWSQQFRRFDEIAQKMGMILYRTDFSRFFFDTPLQKRNI